MLKLPYEIWIGARYAGLGSSRGRGGRRDRFVSVVAARVVSVVAAGVVVVVAARAIGVVGEVSTINSGFVVNLMKASWSVVGSPALLFDVSGIVKNQRFFDDLFLPQTEKMPFCFRVIPNFAQIHFFS